jgi:peptide/nickel transport system permease protein
MNRYQKKIVASLILVVACGGLIYGATTYNPIHLCRALEQPSLQHFWGTDAFGKDLLLLSLSASLTSILTAALALLGGIGISLFLGTAIGVSKGILGWLFRQILEILIAVPGLLIALAASAVLGPKTTTLVVVLTISIIPTHTRFIALRTEEIEKDEYVLASHALGATRLRILMFHILPACLKLIWVKVPSSFVNLILAETSLSFLGVGVPIGTETLGSLLAQGKDYLIEAPHILVFSGIPLFLIAGTVQIISRKFRDGEVT